MKLKINQYIAQTITVASLLTAMFVGIHLAQHGLSIAEGVKISEVLALALVSFGIVVAVDLFAFCADEKEKQDE